MCKTALEGTKRQVTVRICNRMYRSELTERTANDDSKRTQNV
jgi:hypothetical protein